MEEVTLVGIDLGKHSFHLHAQDQKGKEVFRRKVTRRQLVVSAATWNSMKTDGLKFTLMKR
ncbi:hypothetical protein HDG37_005881 [Paraburkholderia sp. MM5384-R2]|nr:hypothetical protein [Paraburkholderia sp. MM5384-R2]